MSLTHSLPAKILSLKGRQAALDIKGEGEELSEDEYAKLHGIITDIHTLSRLNSSICWQHPRLNWLRDGDANSKYFHSVFASWRRRNSLCSIVWMVHWWRACSPCVMQFTLIFLHISVRTICSGQVLDISSSEC